MRQHESVRFAVEREAVHAVGDREDENGRWPVDGEAGGHLAIAWLQERRLPGLAVLALRRLRAAQHREDGADRDVDVDVR